MNEDSWSDSFVWNIPQPELLDDHSKRKDSNPKETTIPQFDGNFDTDASSSDDFKKTSLRHKMKVSTRNKKPSLTFTNPDQITKEEQSNSGFQDESLAMSIAVAPSKKRFTKVTNKKQVKRKTSREQSKNLKRKRGNPIFTVHNESCLKFIDESIPAAISPFSKYHAAVAETEETLSCKCPTLTSTKNKAEYIKECYKHFKLKDCKVELTDVKKTFNSLQHTLSHTNYDNQNRMSQTTPTRRKRNGKGKQPKLRMKFKKNKSTGSFYIKNSPQTPQSTTEGGTVVQAASKESPLLRTMVSSEDQVVQPRNKLSFHARMNEQQIVKVKTEIDTDIEILDLSHLMQTDKGEYHDSLHKLSFKSPIKDSSNQEESKELPGCSAVSPCYSDISEEFAYPNVSLDEIPESPERQPIVDTSDALPELSTYGTPTKFVVQPVTRRKISNVKQGKNLDFTPTQSSDDAIHLNSPVNNGMLHTSQILKDTPTTQVDIPSRSSMQKELICNTISCEEELISTIVSDKLDNSGSAVSVVNVGGNEANNENTDAYLTRTLSYSLDCKEMNQITEKTTKDKENQITHSETEERHKDNSSDEVKNQLVETDVEIMKENDDSHISAPSLDMERKKPPICTFKILFESNESSSSHGETSKSESLEHNKPVICDRSEEVTSIETDLHQPEPDMLSPLMYDTDSFLFKTREREICNSEMGDESVVSSNCEIKSGDLQLSPQSRSTISSVISPRFVHSQEYENITTFQQPTLSPNTQILSPESLEYEYIRRPSSSQHRQSGTSISPRFVYSEEYQTVKVLHQSGSLINKRESIEPLKENTLEKHLILKPQKKPPSFVDVLQTLDQFNMNETKHQEAFYDDEKDGHNTRFFLYYIIYRLFVQLCSLM